MLKSFLSRELHHVSVQHWLLAVATVVAVTATLRVIRWAIVRHHLSDGRNGPRHWHDVIIACAQRTNWAFQVAFGLAVARYVVNIPDPWDRRLQALIMVTAIIQCGFWANGIVDYLVLAKLDSVSAHSNGGAAYRTSRSMLRSVGLVVVWAAVALMACENLGIHVSTLVAGLGITGVAVAFATQNILSDLIASVSMLLDKPFLVGDFIIVDAFQGTIERIGVRTTRLRSLSGELIVMANSDLAKSRLRNYGRMGDRRMIFQFAVSYRTPAAKLRIIGERVKHIIESCKKTRFDRSNWVNFTDSGLVIECVFFVLDNNYNLALEIQEQVYLGIYEMLEAEGVDWAYGTQLRWAGPSDTAPQLAAGSSDAQPRRSADNGKDAAQSELPRQNEHATNVYSQPSSH